LGLVKNFLQLSSDYLRPLNFTFFRKKIEVSTRFSTRGRGYYQIDQGGYVIDIIDIITG